MTRFQIKRKLRKACSKAKYAAVGAFSITQENPSHVAFSSFVKRSTMKVSALSLMGIAGVVVASPSQAAVVNGGFETGNFSGWTTIGNTSIETSAFGSGPVEGTSQALLSTEGSTISGSGLETFLGLASGSLNDLGNGDATSGSAIKQTFNANAGDVLNFSWNFLTNEDSTLFNDFAFVSLSTLSELADTFSIYASSSPSFPPFSTPFLQQTGFNTFSFTIPTSGTYTLGVGVTNENGPDADSGLLVDKVTLTPVPEPLTILGSLAAGGVGVALRKKYKKQQ